MTLIVEDGTGLPNADSYASVATADAYHSAMGNSSWAAATTTDKESSLRRATQYLDTRYAYKGYPLTEGQALAWPRDYAAWPVRNLVNACCELALRALTAQLYTDQSASAITQETVGSLSVSYAVPQNGGQVGFILIDDMLRGLTTGSGRSTLRIERAS